VYMKDMMNIRCNVSIESDLHTGVFKVE